jgi:hypothetical protein
MRDIEAQAGRGNLLSYSLRKKSQDAARFATQVRMQERQRTARTHLLRQVGNGFR